MRSSLVWRAMSGRVPFYEGPRPSLSEVKKEFGCQGEGTVDLQIGPERALLTLNNAKIKNAFSGTMMCQLSERLERLEAWDGAGLLVTGAGSNFCSGGDLALVRSLKGPSDGFKLSTVMTDNLNRLEHLPCLTAAYIEGVAIGGGAEVAVACDFRLMAPTSKIGFVHTKMGIVPAWGGAARLSRFVSHSQALDLIASSRILTAQEALQIGLADGIVSNCDEASAWLDKRTQNGRVVRSAKAALMAADIDRENRFFTALSGGGQNIKALNSNIKHKE